MSFTGWVGYNCLRSCIATLAKVNIDRVPDQRPFVEGEGFDLWGYSDRLAATLGYRFRMLPWSVCPPGDERYWIAVIHTSQTEAENAHHAIACRGPRLLHDPSDIVKSFQLESLEYGLVLVPA
jgi:hypothetical protein